MSARAAAVPRTPRRAAASASPSGAAPIGSALASISAELERGGDLSRARAAQIVSAVQATLTALEAKLETRTREVEEQRHFIEQVVDALPVGLYVVDRDYRVKAWNHKRETGLQGIDRGEAIGRTIFEILHRQPAESLRREFDAVFATGEMRQFQTESASSAGEGRPATTYRISKIPLRLDGGAVTHVISIGEDVSAWKAAEARVALNEKLAAIGQLAAGVMHEINNPLATIAACAESLALQVEPTVGADPSLPPVPFAAARQQEYLRVIDAEVHRCKRIVTSLLNFSRARAVEREPVDLNAIVEQTLFLLKHHARFKRLAVTLDLDRTVPLIVEANGEQLVQVLMALLHNAADAVGERLQIKADRVRRRDAGARASGRRPAERGTGPGPASVIVRTRVSERVGADDWVMIEVDDAGVGIPPGDISKIFEPFFTTKATGQGTGLGLSVCYGIVADHGGRMDVTSEMGRGSQFRVMLPRRAAQAAAQGTNEGYTV